MTGSRDSTIHALICLLLVLAAGTAASAQNMIDLERPGDREFVRDLADMIDSDTEGLIQQRCDALLTEKATPIIVITIRSMAAHGGANVRIETFATLLFDQWGIGIAELGGQQWNTGILLLVAEEDRKARIELGAGWGRRQDALCQRIMDEYIIAEFKRENFSEGILAGVEALDAMARELELPMRPRPWWHFALIAGAVALAIFTIVSLIRRGASGWAWLMWGAIFTVIGVVLYQMATNRGGGGGFGGGSFGGGFSGGGGATGSW